MNKELALQKTSLLGYGGIAVAMTAIKSAFMDVPVEQFVIHLQSLTVNQVFEIVIPLVLGTIGIIYDEDKKSYASRNRIKI